MSSLAIDRPATGFVLPERRGLRARLSLVLEVVLGGFRELWAHRLRSLLTLLLLMLGVFALVVLTSVLDGVMDKIATGFAGMSWDGTVLLKPRDAETTEEARRFALSAGLRYEDLPRITAPHPKIAAFIPRTTHRVNVQLPGGEESIFVNGVMPDYTVLMNRPIASGRTLTEDDLRRRSTVAVVGATLASQLYGGADPLGRDLVVEGVPYRIVGVQAPGQLFSDENWTDAHGILVPLSTYMDRIDPRHYIDQVGAKLVDKDDVSEVSAILLARAKQAHHGIDDVEVVDLEAEGAKEWANFLEQMHAWRVVLMSLAATVLLVGGVGVLSVMLISLSDRRFEIGLRKAMGATDGEILAQFLLEAIVLAALGASVGTVSGALLCRALGPIFPYGLVVNPMGLVVAWIVALGLSVLFGLYPAVRAARLSPVEAMR